MDVTHQPHLLLQMHEMLQLLHQDVDSETGSYTDSGRGPSEEGDNNAHGNTLETHLGAETKSRSNRLLSP